MIDAFKSGHVYKIIIKKSSITDNSHLLIEIYLRSYLYNKKLDKQSYIEIGPLLCLKDSVNSNISPITTHSCFVGFKNDIIYDNLIESLCILNFGSFVFKCNFMKNEINTKEYFNLAYYALRIPSKPEFGVNAVRISKHSKPAKMLINEVLNAKYLYKKNNYHIMLNIVDLKNNKIKKNSHCPCLSSFLRLRS